MVNVNLPRRSFIESLAALPFGLAEQPAADTPTPLAKVPADEREFTRLSSCPAVIRSTSKSQRKTAAAHCS